MEPLILEDIDLAELTGTLARSCAGGLPHGYVVGKTCLRDATMDALACSAVEAETLVEQLELGGFAVFERTGGGPGGGRGTWHLVPEPPSVA